MKILILNHTTHNKGDNSVLFNLLNAIEIADLKGDITISTSDGSQPFWLTNRNDINYISWLGGKMYKSPKSSFLSNVFKVVNRVLNQKFIFPFLFYCLNLTKGVFKFFLNIFFNRFYRQVLASDLIICTGGHHISTVLEKNGVNSQTMAIIASGQLSQNFILWSQSIGPIPNNKMFNRLLGDSLRNHRVLIRDEDSIKILKNLNVNNYNLLPDSVFLSHDSKNVEKKNIVTVSVYTAGLKDKFYLEKYKSAWINLIDDVIEKYNYDFQFMPMQYKGFGGDERSFLNEIIKSSKYPNKLNLLDKDLSPKESISIFNSSKLIIGHKTHSVIYALSTGTPVIALAYHPKTSFFMKTFQFEKYCFNDIIDNEKKIISVIDDAIKIQSAFHSKEKLNLKNKNLLINEIKSWNYKR